MKQGFILDKEGYGLKKFIHRGSIEGDGPGVNLYVTFGDAVEFPLRAQWGAKEYRGQTVDVSVIVCACKKVQHGTNKMPKQSNVVTCLNVKDIEVLARVDCRFALAS